MRAKLWKWRVDLKEGCTKCVHGSKNFVAQKANVLGTARASSPNIRGQVAQKASISGTVRVSSLNIWGWVEKIQHRRLLGRGPRGGFQLRTTLLYGRGWSLLGLGWSHLSAGMGSRLAMPLRPLRSGDSPMNTLWFEIGAKATICLSLGAANRWEHR